MKSMLEWKLIEGFTPYKTALDLMEQRVSSLQIGADSEVIMLVEHEDVYTAGTSYKAEELLNPSGIDVYYTGRGGKFTYHGPGQRVIYPILNLSSSHRTQDIRQYVQNLEEWMVLVLNYFNIDAFITKDRVGIWVASNGIEKKIGAIGVRIKKWVTYHGIAMNINTELSKFCNIIPCGLREYEVTSMKELGVNIDLSEFDIVLKDSFYQIFGKV